ncbi:MAG: hypothetical protein KatS3mg063_2676 [Tepidiforma sp.]|uniref:hypothetical protein n=1 Tax=Tepidiforma sp. TaxID=2682230 RepID=UPI0021DCECE9|nr:hypothetical protein [Tepidiforma sp.]GIV93840.1 MAG: hypothetical protein KatS3mg056_2549 [Chloroflexus sp.]GIW16823.1 MAG: hypothetical protein KatS3mg063_2676 [Tepidiforma sp.]
MMGEIAYTAAQLAAVYAEQGEDGLLAALRAAAEAQAAILAGQGDAHQTASRLATWLGAVAFALQGQGINVPLAARDQIVRDCCGAAGVELIATQEADARAWGAELRAAGLTPEDVLDAWIRLWREERASPWN